MKNQISNMKIRLKNQIQLIKKILIKILQSRFRNQTQSEIFIKSDIPKTIIISMVIN